MSVPVPVPAHVQPFVDALGEDEAMRFLLNFGGAEVYWATVPKTRSDVVKVMGREAALALAAVNERLPKRVPTAKPWLAKRLKSKGLTHAAIARELHTTDVTVRKYLAGWAGKSASHADPRQLPLL